MVVGDFPLAGKIAVVTGGGSGIGLAFVKLALKEGAKVLVADLRLTSEAESLIKGSDGAAAYMRCDVSEWKELEAIPSEVSKAFGQGAVADVWVPNAGVFEPKWSSFLYDPEDEHYKVLQINTAHPIKLTRIAMRSCVQANKPGVVMLVSSGAGVVGAYGAALYCASKHAVVGFAKSMGQADVDENIKVVCILPGMVSTPLWTGDAAKDVATQFGYTDEMCITADEVAEGMKDLITKSEYPGGTLMLCAKGAPRHCLESRQLSLAEGYEEEVAKKYHETHSAPIRQVWNDMRGKAQ